MHKKYINLLILLLIFNSVFVVADPKYFARTAIKLEPAFYTDQYIDKSLHSDGRVYFEAVKTSNDKRGLYITGGPGGFQKIFESGEAAPQLAGLTMSGPVGSWVAHDNGYAFQVSLNGEGVNSTNNIALYAGSFGSDLRLIYREGDEIPGFAGSTYSLGTQEISVRSNGDVFFQVNMSNPNFTNSLLIYNSSENSTTVHSETANDLTRHTPLLHPNGNIAFFGYDNGESKIYAGAPENIQPLIIITDKVPGTSDNMTKFTGLSFATATSLVFAAQFDDFANTNRIYSGLTLLENDLRLVSQGFDISVNSNKKVSCFFAQDWIISEQNEITPTTIAQGSMQAPDMPGVFFNRINRNISSNDFNQISFTSSLFGNSVNTSNDDSLWIYGPLSGLHAIAREGSEIQIGIAGNPVIQTLDPFTSSIDFTFEIGETLSLNNGLNKGFNKQGEVLYHANFTDGTSAILVTQTISPEYVFENGFD